MFLLDNQLTWRVFILFVYNGIIIWVSSIAQTFIIQSQTVILICSRPWAFKLSLILTVISFIIWLYLLLFCIRRKSSSTELYIFIFSFNAYLGSSHADFRCTCVLWIFICLLAIVSFCLLPLILKWRNSIVRWAAFLKHVWLSISRFIKILILLIHSSDSFGRQYIIVFLKRVSKIWLFLLPLLWINIHFNLNLSTVKLLRWEGFKNGIIVLFFISLIKSIIIWLINLIWLIFIIYIIIVIFAKIKSIRRGGWNNETGLERANAPLLTFWNPIELLLALLFLTFFNFNQIIIIILILIFIIYFFSINL